MRTVATAGVIAGAIALQPVMPESVHTLAQHDPWRTAFEPASASLSADGRYIAFTSYARLDQRDVDDRRDIYVLDRVTGQVSAESLEPTREAEQPEYRHPRLNGDGRVIVYEKALSAHSDIVIRDRLLGDTQVITAGWRGAKPDGFSRSPEISRDARIVVFSSTATNLSAASDANGAGEDIYLFDRESRAIERISVTLNGQQSSGGSSVGPSISGDGRYVAFASSADLSPPDGAGSMRRRAFDIYVVDRSIKTIRLVSRGGRDRANSGSWAPALSADGRFLAFVSDATNLVPDDRNNSPDVFVADLSTNQVELVSRTASGAAANGRSAAPAISEDGQIVAFQSEASDLLCHRRCPPAVEDINLLWDVFVMNRRTGTVRRVSRDATKEWMEPSTGPAINGSGKVVVFSSRHPIETSDTNNDFDLFICAPRP